MKEKEIKLTPTKDPNTLERDRRRVAAFTVTPALLAAAMELPEGTEIIGAEWDFACSGVRLIVRGPQFRSVAPGCIPTTVTPTVTMHNDDAGHHRFVYDWGVPQEHTVAITGATAPESMSRVPARMLFRKGAP